MEGDDPRSLDAPPCIPDPMLLADELRTSRRHYVLHFSDPA
jgi:hypothetical protein